MSSTEIMSPKFVYVYGYKCKIKRLSKNETIAMFLEDLEATKTGDTIRIMSGEANSELYNQVEEVVKKHCSEKNLRFEMIAGPLLSVSQDDGHKKNAVIDLAKGGCFYMYRSKIRRELHFRIVQDNILRGELPHLPADYNDRLGFTINAGLIKDREERDKALFAINNRIKDFESAKMFCEYVAPRRIEEEFLLLTNNQILMLHKKASREHTSIDRLPRNQIMKLLT